MTIADGLGSAGVADAGKSGKAVEPTGEANSGFAGRPTRFGVNEAEPGEEMVHFEGKWTNWSKRVHLPAKRMARRNSGRRNGTKSPSW